MAAHTSLRDGDRGSKLETPPEPPKPPTHTPSTARPSSPARTVRAPAPQVREAIAEGTTWGSFRITRRLGGGGMGTVYEAWDSVLDRPVALKVLAPERAGARHGGPDAGLREARAAARLDHPNIVTVYQVGDNAGVGFIAMQLVRGGSAASALPRPVDETVRIVRAVAEALGHAHRHGLVHRDVKPENILLGADGVVKLADFGIAQTRDVGTVRSGSAADKVCGTPAFMSPEQAQGLKLDGRSDLYGLGATWFALLTGRPPFRGRGALEVLMAHVEQPAPDVRQLRPDVPPLIAGLVAWMLNKRPDDRPATAEELVAAIDAAASATVPVQPAAPVAGTAPRRRRAPLLAFAAVFAATFGGALALGGSDASEHGATKVGGTTPADARHAVVSGLPDLPVEPDRARSADESPTAEAPAHDKRPAASGTSPEQSTPPRPASSAQSATPTSPRSDLGGSNFGSGSASPFQPPVNGFQSPWGTTPQPQVNPSSPMHQPTPGAGPARPVTGGRPRTHR